MISKRTSDSHSQSLHIRDQIKYVRLNSKYLHLPILHTKLSDLVNPSDLAGLGALVARRAGGQSQLFLALLAALQSTFTAAPQHLSFLGVERERYSVGLSSKLGHVQNREKNYS